MTIFERSFGIATSDSSFIFKLRFHHVLKGVIDGQ